MLCKFSIPDDLWLFNYDRGQIGRVIKNIIQNAGQAMPAGGVVEVSCQNEEPRQGECVPSPQDQKQVKISIKDNGAGIPANIMNKIFEPYFSIKEEGKDLDLAISHSLFLKHKGHISVQSEPGAGTIFSICLPASVGKLEKRGYEENRDNQSLQAKILVMDGDIFVRDVTEQMLEHLGHTVICAKNGAETVQLYEDSTSSDQPFDLVIMDLTVPGTMDGKEVSKKILAIDPAAKIILSGDYPNDLFVANYSEYGFCSTIAKPYLLEELKEIVNGALMERKY